MRTTVLTVGFVVGLALVCAGVSWCWAMWRLRCRVRDVRAELRAIQR